jgi:uncharacterized Ntn-hydrolase superfamily protein
MTFSIAARSDDGTMYGIAIASSSPAVAARCVHLRSGIGAVASQNVTDPALGGKILDLMARGQSAKSALGAVLEGTPFAPYRQLIVVGNSDLPAIHTGAHALGLHASETGSSAAAAGNLLANAGVPQAMVRAYNDSRHPFAERLLQALRAGRHQGGESGPIYSAGLVVVRADVSWPIVDLRIDWLERDPIEALAYLWGVYAPQIEDYVNRALDPARASHFGVPGDPA